MPALLLEKHLPVPGIIHSSFKILLNWKKKAFPPLLCEQNTQGIQQHQFLWGKSNQAKANFLFEFFPQRSLIADYYSYFASPFPISGPSWFLPPALNSWKTYFGLSWTRNFFYFRYIFSIKNCNELLWNTLQQPGNLTNSFEMIYFCTYLNI